MNLLFDKLGKLKIIYVSCLVSEERFAKLYSSSLVVPGQQVQKYHRLLAEGLSRICDVETISAIPMSRKIDKRILIVEKGEMAEKIKYNYLVTLNVPIIKNIYTMISSFYTTLKKLITDRSACIVVDVLNSSVSLGAILACKALNRISVGIVTDVPDYLDDGSNRLSSRLSNVIIRNCKAYIFLTQQMNSLLNEKHLPYIVIEGMVDIKMTKKLKNADANGSKKICLYTGGIYKKYGIDQLVKGFIKADVANCELHIFGDGDFKSELEIYCTKYQNIKFLGVKPNEDIIKAQLKASLLVNPRPTNGEYVKYSFPSKNMEYMASGTPVLTTFLPGIPVEYFKFCYIIEEETQDGICNALINTLAQSNIELFQKGMSAREFVLTNKNNLVQSQRVVEFINEITANRKKH